jgi:hypothetical protein
VRSQLFGFLDQCDPQFADRRLVEAFPDLILDARYERVREAARGDNPQFQARVVALEVAQPGVEGAVPSTGFGEGGRRSLPSAN